MTGWRLVVLMAWGILIGALFWTTDLSPFVIILIAACGAAVIAPHAMRKEQRDPP